MLTTTHLYATYAYLCNGYVYAYSHIPGFCFACVSNKYLLSTPEVCLLVDRAASGLSVVSRSHLPYRALTVSKPVPGFAASSNSGHCNSKAVLVHPCDSDSLEKRVAVNMGEQLLSVEGWCLEQALLYICYRGPRFWSLNSERLNTAWQGVYAHVMFQSCALAVSETRAR